ncbi:MAG TPA: alpha/beta fold hydrolase [Acidimicrobiales bacterium]|jgi:2-succinyl-6-hydroxy-2,4-cyclohexadiene-1-carboxylate synthase|nr:alpha/beta fold hydrolase [Acidimicrobiales bacterium]
MPPPEPAVLHLERDGQGPAPRLVMAHGFTQTGRLWGPFGPALAAGRELVRVDLPGHGGSSAVRADLEEGGALLAAAAGGSPFDLLGYSLGARFALHAALHRPELVRRLVLVGGTAGLDDPADRAARRARDQELADRLERSGDLDGFLGRWMAAPMFAGLRTPDPAERRRNTPAGLASSLRLAGTGTQLPLWGRLTTLAVPTLVLAGADDPRFTTVGRRLAGVLPDAAFSLVPGAGHAAHLQQPALTARLVDQFLRAGPGPA